MGDADVEAPRSASVNIASRVFAPSVANAGEVPLSRGPYLPEAAPTGIPVLWHRDQPTLFGAEYRSEDAE